MGSIRVLPEQLINQIAAGEVIERPASVVKELVENAIDAKATRVTIEIVKGGTEKIVITDDGVGMDEMDARLAFERHATSKIQSVEDLFRIRSLGFRGEALASIAAVSSVVLQTKTASSIGGIRLEMSGGKNPVVTATGASTGTKLEISQLFFNIPARKKYLKSEQTEYRHVLETVQDLALAHPEITFRFLSNGRTVFDFLKTDELKARIGGLFGRAVSEEMVSVFYGGRDIQITGYTGKPHTARTTRKYQYFIINGRPVQDHRLSYAVKEAYSNLIPASQHPIFVLAITIASDRIDVNVHPRKLEVRFADPQEIFRVLKSSVSASIGRESMTQNIPLRDRNLDMPAFLRKNTIKPVEQLRVDIEEAGGDYDPYLATAPTSLLGASAPSPASSFFSAPMTPAVGSPNSLSELSGNDLDARKAYLMQKRAERLAAQDMAPEAPMAAPMFAQPVSSPITELTASFNEERAPGSLKAIAQVAQSYLIAQDDEGIVIIDQHAAHERVMLGKFRANESEREPVKQPLLAPIQLDLDYRERAILEENLDLLRGLGFELSEFGGNTYTVDAVPDFLANEDLDEIMKGFLDDLLNDEPPKEAARRHEHILHTLACRAAAKFGRRLSSYEQDALIHSLLETEGSCACAHGRPTMIRLSFNELEQKFGRKG